MSANQSDGFLNSEAHTMNKNIKDVVLAKSSIRKSTNRRTMGFIGLIATTTSPRDMGTPHVLNRDTSS
jgi:hypothetical protein